MKKHHVIRVNVAREWFVPAAVLYGLFYYGWLADEGYPFSILYFSVFAALLFGGDVLAFCGIKIERDFVRYDGRMLKIIPRALGFSRAFVIEDIGRLDGIEIKDSQAAVEFYMAGDMVSVNLKRRLGLCFSRSAWNEFVDFLGREFASLIRR